MLSRGMSCCGSEKKEWGSMSWFGQYELGLERCKPLNKIEEMCYEDV
jgi:hypothetical protein